MERRRRIQPNYFQIYFTWTEILSPSERTSRVRVWNGKNIRSDYMILCKYVAMKSVGQNKILWNNLNLKPEVTLSKLYFVCRFRSTELFVINQLCYRWVFSAHDTLRLFRPQFYSFKTSVQCIKQQQSLRKRFLCLLRNTLFVSWLLHDSRKDWCDKKQKIKHPLQ